MLERLGVGAVGEVFLARSRGGKLVAVKTIARDPVEGDGLEDTFVREASVCARLDHPCIVQMRAFLDQPGFAALVFEYVPGVALARVLRLSELRGVRLPDRAAWHVVERVLTALAYAHAFQGEAGQPTPIVHRDLSPSNVLLDWSGGVKIADFGIAKILGATTATRVGIVKGTPGCMAPEQARGEPVDERADVYAAALLAWRLSTGRLPFAKHLGDEFELLRAMRNPRIHPLDAIRPDMAPPLLEVVARALEADPQRRTLGAKEFSEVIRAHVDVAAGVGELSALLERWKPALERAVKRGKTHESDAGARAENTMRYEEAALAFDDDPPLDSQTYEAHALPSEPVIALGPAPLEPLDPPAIAEAALPPAALTDPGIRAPSWAFRLWTPVLVFLAFLVVGAAAAALASWMR